MSRDMSWEELLERKGEYIGGEILEEGVDAEFRGPIQDIVEDGNMVRVVSQWCARRKKGDDRWEWWAAASSAWDRDMASLVFHDDGSIEVCSRVPMSGSCELRPKTFLGDKLTLDDVVKVPQSFLATIC